jgi:hypothetical protein
MLGDSHTSANTFGFYGGQFSNVPKSKFMFYVKFFRPENQGGSAWERGICLALKAIDRPRVSFEQQTLNQYNKKRIVQTSHSFEAVQLRFHDTVDESINLMFQEYYNYYYGDSKNYSEAGALYDVTSPEFNAMGEWGYHPQLADQNYAYFFSHMSIYQLYNGMVAQTDLFNPKIQYFNPDELDYSNGQTSNEVQMGITFEGLAYRSITPITDELAADMGIDRGQYYDLQESVPTTSVGTATGATDPRGKYDNFDIAAGVLKDNIAGLVTGKTKLSEVGAEFLNVADLNRGFVTGKSAIKGISDLVSGQSKSIKPIKNLITGIKYGKPGGWF